MIGGGRWLSWPSPSEVDIGCRDRFHWPFCSGWTEESWCVLEEMCMCRDVVLFLVVVMLVFEGSSKWRMDCGRGGMKIVEDAVSKSQNLTMKSRSIRS